MNEYNLAANSMIGAICQWLNLENDSLVELSGLRISTLWKSGCDYQSDFSYSNGKVTGQVFWSHVNQEAYMEINENE